MKVYTFNIFMTLYWCNNLLLNKTRNIIQTVNLNEIIYLKIYNINIIDK